MSKNFRNLENNFRRFGKKLQNIWKKFFSSKNILKIWEKF